MVIFDIIAGTRPNFIKVAALIHAFKEHAIAKKTIIRFIHTGQHFDKNMSDTFFDDLELPEPNVNFNVGSGSHAQQTSQIMMAYEKLLEEKKSNLCIVVGDVNSTMACALVAKKMQVKVAHVEAGIRSYDMNMPEEINRLVTDSITDCFFTTTAWASSNLIKNGIPESNIFLVGNTMIDTLVRNQPKFRKPTFFEVSNLKEKKYNILTLHRPSNVDNKDNLIKVIDTISKNSSLPIVFPIHPRTKKILGESNFSKDKLHIVEPMGYLEFLYLIEHANAIITDSGGITEEATFLNIPCMTLRTSTERPETVEIGTNELIGDNPLHLIPYLNKLEHNEWKKGTIPYFWDGNTGKRVWDVLNNIV